MNEGLRSTGGHSLP